MHGVALFSDVQRAKSGCCCHVMHLLHRKRGQGSKDNGFQGKHRTSFAKPGHKGESMVIHNIVIHVASSGNLHYLINSFRMILSRHISLPASEQRKHKPFF